MVESDWTIYTIEEQAVVQRGGHCPSAPKYICKIGGNNGVTSKKWCEWLPDGLTDLRMGVFEIQKR